MTAAEIWRPRARTAEAAIELLLARAAILVLPLKTWNRHFALTGMPAAAHDATARPLSAHVRRAAQKLPFESKCLPQALALSRMLRRRQVPHRLVIAARPEHLRGGDDDLHAWIEVGGRIVLGELPGPWFTVLALPPMNPDTCAS